MSGPRPGDGFFEYSETGSEIRAIYGVAFNAVTNGLTGEVFAGKLAVSGRRVGELVVCNRDHKGQFFHGR